MGRSDCWMVGDWDGVVLIISRLSERRRAIEDRN